MRLEPGFNVDLASLRIRSGSLGLFMLLSRLCFGDLARLSIRILIIDGQ